MANPITNQGSEKDWLISAPAFSITKVQTTIGLFITAVLGALPASLEADRSIVIAAIAAGTLILLGVLALVAMDMHVRQRAEEAKLRYGEGSAESDAALLAAPSERLRVMKGDSDREFEVDVLKVADGAVRLVVTRDGDTTAVPFNKTE